MNIESGLRWGELTEVRVSDLDLASRMLTVSRKVIELNREFHPDGKRFLVKHYPKDKEYRRLKLSPQIMAKLKAHIKAHKLELDAHLFARRAPAPVPLQMVTEPGMPGFTEPNEAALDAPTWPLAALHAQSQCVRRAFHLGGTSTANGSANSPASHRSIGPRVRV
jgi:hypothetical protein